MDNYLGDRVQRNAEDLAPIADPYLAETVGEQAVGGSTPTPDQDNADILGAAVGYELKDGEEVGLKNRLDEIDAHRPELEPDYY